MSKSSFTISDSDINSNGGHSVSVEQPLSGDDFVMMCPFGDTSLNEAILSLYYLPPQFKLRVFINADSAKMPFSGHDAVRGRISIETETGTPTTVSPFSSANAVVYSETTPVKSESATPRVVISKAAHTPLESIGNSFTISEDNPEALASALLSIAKATA